MSIKKEFSQLEMELEELYEEQDKLHRKVWDLEKRRTFLLVQYIVEENILAKQSWTIKYDNYGGAMLNCDVDANEFKELSDLAETNYHCSTDLGKGSKLHFDDGNISISFDDAALLPTFIKTYGIKISASLIKKEYEDLKKQLTKIEEIYNIIHNEK